MKSQNFPKWNQKTTQNNQNPARMNWSEMKEDPIPFGDGNWKPPKERKKIWIKRQQQTFSAVEVTETPINQTNKLDLP